MLHVFPVHNTGLALCHISWNLHKFSECAICFFSRWLHGFGHTSNAMGPLLATKLGAPFGSIVRRFDAWQQPSAPVHSVFFFWGAYVQTYTNHNVLDHVGQVLLSRYSIWFIINIQHFQSSALSKLFGSSALHQWQWEHRKVDGVDTSLSYFSLSYFGQDGNWDGTPCSQQFPRRSAKVFDPDFRRMIFYTFEPLYSYRI